MKSKTANQSTIFLMPRDIWGIIASYLTLDEIANVKLACKSLYKSLNDTALDSIWMPFLKRLQIMDPSISVNIPAGKIRENFLEAAKKVSQDQKEEIELFKESLKKMQGTLIPIYIQNTATRNIAILEKKLKEIANLDLSLRGLVLLEKSHSILNALNADLIENIIKKLNNKFMKKVTSDSDFSEDQFSAGAILKLKGEDYSLTRIPSEIFLHPDYQLFWQSRGSLDCTGQKIRFIGEGIDVCTNLQGLHISKNQLVALPQSLASLKNIQAIRCTDNELTSLPNIPDSCTALFVAQNYLTEIPQGLKDKFGEEWSEIMLVLQKTKPRTMIMPSLPKEPIVELVEDTTIVSKVASSLSGYMPSFIMKRKKEESLKEETTESSVDIAKKMKPD